MRALDFGTAALLFGFFGLILFHLAREIAGWPRRLCAAILAAAMACTVADMLVRAAPRYPVPIPVYRALLVVQSMTAPFPALLVFAYISSGSTVIIFVEFLLVYDLIRRFLAQQEESRQQRTRLAVAQMRPHFIYNTLLSLYYLCAQDTEKTQRVIRDFIRYLQNNFNAIAEEKPILFEKELEHTKAYLAVEQACHEGSLFVEFDTPDLYFRVPALTLQPIVENAVKHGLLPGYPPLYVSIATEDTGTGVRITVEDTGPGISPVEYSERHVTLDNIRERLKTLCGGTLAIEPRESGGTKVTIFVPHR